MCSPVEKMVRSAEFVYILGIPHRATIALQSRELTLSDVFGIWLKMELHSKNCNRNPSKTGLSNHLLNALSQRKEKIFSNPFVACAIFLDPRFRSQIMNNEEKVAQAKETLINLWHRINETSVQEESQPNELASISSSVDFNESDELDKFLGFTQSNNNRLTDIEFLLENFDPGRLSSKESVLNYWQTVKSIHVELYQLAQIVYSIPPTEVQIERDFSKLGYVFNDRRCNLIQDRLEDVMILNLNPDLFYVVKQEELRELLK